MIRLDYTLMTGGAVAGGLTPDELRVAGAEIARARAAVGARRSAGEVGFLDLPADREILSSVEAAAGRILDRGAGDVVVLGIGGSALGPIALRTALCAPGWNTLSDAERGGLPRLHVLDNVDPRTISALLPRLPLERTVFLVVSKSGGTAETMAQYLIVRGRLDEAGLSARDHLVFITDPARGALRAIARAEGVPALAIPPNVGGRFSVLTAVGLLPAALVGIDVRGLREGAGAMLARCQSADPLRDPAGVFAALQWLADTRRGRRIHVFMPYSDALRDVAAWFVQLWAESLGKTRADGTNAGPTPVAALGATDQHSQVQLFMEGPPDKTVTFVAVGEGEPDLPIPGRHPEMPDLAYLAGHRLGELLAAERRATAAALAARGRPNMTLAMERVDAWHLGGLLMLLEVATAYAGELYGVNAFDQPGVELGKRFAYALLGRPGFEDTKREWLALPQSDPAYIV